jgi:hypothetical protein
MRRLPPPTGGVTSVRVRPARRSPVACTVSFSGLFVRWVVGTVDWRSGRLGPAIIMAAPAPTTVMSTAAMRIRRFNWLS